MYKKIIWILVIALMLTGCSMIDDNMSASELLNKKVQELDRSSNTAVNEKGLEMTLLIDPAGDSLVERILCPIDYERKEEAEGTFANYLRKSDLKPHGSDVLLYDGQAKGNQESHVAVFKIDVGNRDLQQCADATMRLWAEYLRSINQDDKIHFEFTNGFRADYSRWMEGYRVLVDGNNVSWVKTREPSKSDETFMSYMKIIFAYAGTLSLSNELESVPIEDMKIGDVFVQGGSPGHAVIVADMALNSLTGEKIFLLAQSYMPAQDIHVLSNPNNELLSPWYLLSDQENIITPEWVFAKSDLKRY